MDRSIDYDVTARATKCFYATAQNKFHWAIHGQTAAEVTYHRADADKDRMGLTSLEGRTARKDSEARCGGRQELPDEHEMAQLQRLVATYLEVAEDMALRKNPMTMQDCETRLIGFIEATDRDVLQDAGKVTAEIAKAHAMSAFEKYRIVQDRLFEGNFDRVIRQIESGGQPDIAEE